MPVVQALRNKVRLRTRLRNARSALQQLRILSSSGLIGRGRRRRLTNVTFYATNLCDCRCIHCGIWQQRPIVHLPFDVFKQVHDSPATGPQTTFGFEGGEFILHPQAEEILAYYQDRRCELYTNGLKPERVRQLVRKFKIPHLILSTEGGNRETYERIRGVDAFERVSTLAEEMAQETQVSISYTITPWNTNEDMQAVRRFCGERGIVFGLNILHTSPFFDKDYRADHSPPAEGQQSPGANMVPLPSIPFASEESIQGDHPVKTDYLLGYNEWLKGAAKIPCTSIFHRIVIYPNGDIPLCQQAEFGILGNLLERRLETIWWSKATLGKQKSMVRCNQCWTSFHRYDDLLIYRALKTFLPEGLIRAWMKRGKPPRKIPYPPVKHPDKP